MRRNIYNLQIDIFIFADIVIIRRKYLILNGLKKKDGERLEFEDVFL